MFHRLLAGIVLFNLNLPVVAADIQFGRLDREMRSALQQGLRLELSCPKSEDKTTDVRVSRLAAIYVPRGEAASAFVPAEQFVAVFNGYLKTRLKEEFSFSFRGHGKLAFSVNGKEVVTVNGDLSKAAPVSIELAKGHNWLHIEYTSPESGPQKFQLLWAGEDFPAEPVPPQLLSHDSRDESVAGSLSTRAGRDLFVSLRCVKCHEVPGGTLVPDSAMAMPELTSDAPHLGATGHRLKAGWLNAWIVDPSSVRNHTTMPFMIPANEKDSAGADIAEYLSTLKTGDPLNPVKSTKESVELGGRLFEERGCMACHRFTSPADSADDEFARVSLHFMNAKYQAGAIQAFLLNPRLHYKWSRMPRIPLTTGEAGLLESFIRSEAKGEVAEAVGGSIERGKLAFARLGCAVCHQREEHEPAVAIEKSAFGTIRIDAGCLGAEPTGKSPHYPLSEEQRQQIASLLNSKVSAPFRDHPVEFAERTIKAMRCLYCHDRDGETAPIRYIIADEGLSGLVPDPIPDLSWTGEKLRAAWTKRLFEGDLNYRSRPHFKIRMPAFPMRGEVLSKGLSLGHGMAVDEDPRPQLDKELAKVGAEIAAPQGGLACQRCHAVGDQPAIAPFEARSINFAWASERLRYDFYHRWMRDPMRIDSQTKMIKFAQDRKKTALTRFYDGDAHKQFDAVWHYLMSISGR